MVEGLTRDSNTPHERLGIFVEGMVQGVGFRPFIYSLATKHHLTGYVLNDSKRRLDRSRG